MVGENQDQFNSSRFQLRRRMMLLDRGSCWALGNWIDYGIRHTQIESLCFEKGSRVDQCKQTKLACFRAKYDGVVHIFTTNRNKQQLLCQRNNGNVRTKIARVSRSVIVGDNLSIPLEA